MWQSPNQRNRALAIARKREKARQTPRMHLKRTMGELRVLPKEPTAPGQDAGEPVTLKARVMLNDLTEKGVGLFTPEPLLAGQKVALALTDPKVIYLRARVVWCQEFETDSRVIRAEKLPYRIGLAFELGSPEEIAQVKAFCQELNREHLMVVPAPAASRPTSAGPLPPPAAAAPAKPVATPEPTPDAATPAAEKKSA